MSEEELKKFKEAAEKRHLKINDYLTVKQAAEYVGVTANTLRNWEKDGKIVTIRNPRNSYRLYKREYLDKFLNNIESQDLI